MVSLAAGSVVLVTFPFSDLSQSKLRPAIVLADAGRNDWILCQVSSNPYGDPKAIEITDNDFSSGSLRRISDARTAKLFTANSSLIAATVGNLKPDAFESILDAVIGVFKSNPA